jgi:hypothetical protein
MNERIREVTEQLKATADEARTLFGGLSAVQLNWKPTQKSWSVAQCFDHLITTHSLYYPLLDRLGTGEFRSGTWEKVSPFSGYFGRFLIRSMTPDNLKKMKTTSKAEPSSSEIDDGVIDRYCEHQEELIERLRQLPKDIDPKKTTITSPLMSLITYSLDDCYTVLVVHGHRHLGQAKRVMEADGFPA